MLQSRNLPTFFLRHQNAEGELNEFDRNFGQDFMFEIVEDSIGERRAVRFKAVNDGFGGSASKMFLRHKNYRILLEDEERTSNPELFRKDSTFFPHLGLASPNGASPLEGLSFEATNVERHFIRHFDFHLFIGVKVPGDIHFEGDATWVKTAPF
ncbi:AbfB domain-containing protein [Streptomyces sp. ISL-66]|uniref:AbfB domain-containing protein n=1 Tax=Streptomyces sp. ISL-66 TaxID=2819186 RepID=UPI001BE89886|nr:AbfB domain-containing protein [Streptomyces sp. ISL-66]MBT2466658.1 AbfB domain-containing protein [Streptomyces sp. ISL-66]